MSIITNIETCRICESFELIDVITLGEQYITSRFPIYGDYSTPKTKIDLCMCENCGLLQLKQTTLSDELYKYEYGYRSGISNTMRNHLKEYQEEILSKIELNAGDTIVDIGSNDSTMLQYYSNKYNRIGVDPTGKQFYEYYKDVKLIADYFTLNNFKNEYQDLKCKIVSSISMFYDLPNPVQFAKDIYEILDDDGIWTCEQSYLITMLKMNSVDTICHEHLEYYTLKQIKYIADQANFKIIDVLFNECNGGSFRIYFAKRKSSKYIENIDLINKILNDEIEYGIMNEQIFKDFMDRINNEVDKLKNFIDCVNKNGKNVYIYGASTKGNCLLQYANINKKKIKYAVERNLNKVGKMTSTGIEIISEETMRKNPPNYLLVLPYHFRNEIIEREKDFLDNGGQLIFPFPNFEIYSNKPKLLLTGCDGFIADYIKSQYSDYTLYGIGHLTEKYESNITKYYMDMNNKNELEKIIMTIHPEIIVHLAGISSSQYAFKNVIETVNINGLLTVYLCDIIHNNKLKTKLFNASSSEIYKGHIDYEVKENDNNMYHLHPYSISKILGHSIVDFYRTTYNLPFSNGIIFTTESRKKKPIFLLNKVANHAKEWKCNKIPLTLGNLDSFRNIIHPSDVAKAINTIIEQKEGDNYLICNEYNIKIIDIVYKIYDNYKIKLEKRENILYDKITNEVVIIINECYNGTDLTIINIRGEPVKLKNLGWNPEYNIDDIIKELCEKSN